MIKYHYKVLKVQRNKDDLYIGYREYCNENCEDTIEI